MITKLVLAGNYQEYLYYYRDKDRKEYVYVSDYNNILGRNPEYLEVIYCGTWYLRDQRLIEYMRDVENTIEIVTGDQFKRIIKNTYEEQLHLHSSK